MAERKFFGRLFGQKLRNSVADAEGGVSLNREVWRRFKRNKMAMTSLVVIILFAITAILGYLITPDSTPYCNQQYLELATLKPGSTATLLCVEENVERERTSLISKMLHGEPLSYYAYPIHKYCFYADSLRVETYTGSTPNDGEILRFALADIAFAVNPENPITRSGNKTTYYDLKNQPHTYSVPELQQYVRKHCIQKRTFVLGTDGYGRDVLSQIMIGSRVSLSVGFIAIAIALLIGITLGALAAYFGRWVDSLIMWFINVVWSIPTVLLVIAITFALGKGFWQVFVAVGLTMWVDVARVVRGQVLSIREKEYVEAAKALGYRTFRIIFRHILPNVLGAVIVIAASNFASAILLEAGLSFLGIGVQPPMPSWGTMVKENYPYILLDSAYLALLPGFAIMIIVLAFMLIGNGIRDALDVKNK